MTRRGKILVLLFTLFLLLLALAIQPPSGDVRLLGTVVLIWEQGQYGIGFVREGEVGIVQTFGVDLATAGNQQLSRQQPTSRPAATRVPGTTTSTTTTAGLTNINNPVNPIVYIVHWSYHSGTWGMDLSCRIGQPIYAFADGVVVYAGPRKGGGSNCIVIRHGSAPQGGYYYTQYLHNSKLLVKVGDVVRGGQQIAACGSEGQSTGPHLHFEFRRHSSFTSSYSGGWGVGESLNPTKYLR